MTAVRPDGRFRAFGYDLIVVDGERATVLKDDYRRLIESIEVHQVWDGADQITINCRAWDERKADWAIVGEKILAPGRQVVLRAGYGARRFPIGKFRIVEHEPSLTQPFPTVRIIGYDGLARLQDNQWPGRYGSPRTWTEIASAVAGRYGFGLVADVSKAIPHRTRKKRVRVRGKKTPGGKPLFRRKTVKTVIAKKAGDTDLKFLKTMASAAGFLWPKVRFVEAGTSEFQTLTNSRRNDTEGTGLVEIRDIGVLGKEVLFFERANRDRQGFGQGEIVFFLDRRDGVPGTLTDFTPLWSTQGVPQRVRVTGVTEDGKHLMRVQAEFVDPALIREGETGSIAITQEHTRKLTKQDKKNFRDPSAVLLDVLNDEPKRVVERDFRTNKRVETLGADVIKSMLVVKTTDDLRDIARSWLLARVHAMTSADASAESTPGLETVYPNQFHRFDGLPAEYAGVYMVREVTHIMQSTSHNVSMKLRRVGEVQPSAKTEGVDVTIEG